MEAPQSRFDRQGLFVECSSREELQSLWDELVVKLEDAAVPRVGIDLELAVRQALGQVDRVERRHHAVVIAVGNEDWLLDGGQIGRLLHTPGVNGLELGAKGYERNRLVAVLGPLLQPLDELPGLPPSIGCRGEEEIILRVFEGQITLENVNDRYLGNLVDAHTAGRAGTSENHLPHELRLQLHDDLGNHAAKRESKQVHLFKSQRPDEGDGVSRHGLDRVGRRAPRGAYPAVVEDDHAALRGDAIHNAWVPIVQHCSQVIQEDHRHAGRGAEFAVGETDITDFLKFG